MRGGSLVPREKLRRQRLVARRGSAELEPGGCALSFESYRARFDRALTDSVTGR